MQFAKYIGTATVRRMTARDWRAAGVDTQETVTWNKGNGYTVAQDQFTDQAWAIVSADPSIVAVGDADDAVAVHEATVDAAVARLRARAATGASAPAPTPVVVSEDV